MNEFSLLQAVAGVNLATAAIMNCRQITACNNAVTLESMQGSDNTDPLSMKVDKKII